MHTANRGRDDRAVSLSPHPPEDSPPDTSFLRDDVSWIALIDELRREQDVLIDSFQRRFPAAELYGGKVRADEIDALVASTMQMYLVLLAGQPLDESLRRLPLELGRRRARQGVPVEQLLEGVRTNSRVIWNALRELAPPGGEATLVCNTDALLNLVEWHVRTVQAGYLREHELLSRRTEQRRRHAIATVFGSNTGADINASAMKDADTGGSAVSAAAAVLGVRSDEVFDVLVEPGAHDLDCSLCRSTDNSTFAAELATSVCHFSPSRLQRLPIHDAESAAPHAVVPGVRSLALVPAAARAGVVLLEAQRRQQGLHDPNRVEEATAANLWPALAWRSLTVLLPADFLPLRLEALATLRPAERARLVETATAYLDTGSIKETASTLYCHRNTIVMRLARFKELTQLDLSRPRQAALAALALTEIGVDTSPQRRQG